MEPVRRGSGAPSGGGAGGGGEPADPGDPGALIGQERAAQHMRSGCVRPRREGGGREGEGQRAENAFNNINIGGDGGGDGRTDVDGDGRPAWFAQGPLREETKL